MRPISLFLAFMVAFLAGCCVHSSSVLAPANPESLVHQTIALVRVGEGSVMTYCSGVFISQTEILTAQHCAQAVANGFLPINRITHNQGVLINFQVFKHGAIHSALVWAEDPEHDLAILRLIDLFPHSYADLALSNPEIGDGLMLVGHPSQHVWTFLRGTLSAIQPNRWQIQAPMWFGLSGGPVFNMQGEIIGISLAIARNAPDMGFAADLQTLKDFIRDSR